MLPPVIKDHFYCLGRHFESLDVYDYPAPLEIETTSTTWSGMDEGGGDGSGISRTD